MERSGRFAGRAQLGLEVINVPWELSPSLPVAPAQQCDKPRRAVSRSIICAKCRQMPSSRESL